MAQKQQGGGNDRQQPANQQGAEQYTPNERLTLGQRLNAVLVMLKQREVEIAAVLPPDMPFAKFHASINQALRNAPDLLDCTSQSLTNACVKSAYDGLRVDGREAAIVSHNVKIKTPGQPDRWEKRAQYFPMVFGLVQQVLRGGMVIAIETDIIYANDAYRIIRGSAPAIEHVPVIIGDRGDPIGAYSVAVLASGYRTFLFMRADEIDDIRKESKSGNYDGKPSGIWKRWWTQMWIKTVIRRHRKTLPLGRDIVDSEANDEFGDLNETPALPAASTTSQQRPARPVEALTHDQLGAGVPLELEEEEGELVENEPVQEQQQTQTQQRQAPAIDQNSDMPADPAEWDMWSSDVSGQIRKGANADVVNDLWARERGRLEKAPRALRDKLNNEFSDRVAELATGGGGTGADADNK